MRFLGRNFLSRNSANNDKDTDAVDVTATESSPKGYTPSKGRPTPKRDTQKRGPVAPPPRTQREAYRRARGSKDQRRTESAERRERMMAGDDRYLMPRDRGPVKAYARDIIDSRRNILGLFMPLALVVLVALFLSNLAVQQYVTYFCTAMLAVMIVEAIVLGRIATKRARKKFPNEAVSALALTWYCFSRASQVRKMRIPRPRVRPGEEV